jgi:beta-phosphoglucomutase family hydrolase
MTSIAPVATLSPRDYDAVLFDLDGVLTRTASVHAAAWKGLFDRFHEQRAADTDEAFVAFDIDADYRRYVDGKPRYGGSAAFLASRGMVLPFGTPADGPGMHTVHALGNLKDQYFRQQLEQHGVEICEAAIALVRILRAQEIKTAVVSSSNNCAAVLEAAGIAPLFDARVDGMDITRLALHGKLAPDAFLEAAQRVKAEPARAVVVEDAIAGVEAGRAGGFGCVIGVDHDGQSPALGEAGADVVVTSLAQVKVVVEPPSAWSLVYEGFDPACEGMREALCALENGYIATRGAAVWARAPLRSRRRDDRPENCCCRSLERGRPSTCSSDRRTAIHLVAWMCQVLMNRNLLFQASGRANPKLAVFPVLGLVTIEPGRGKR